MSWLRVDDGFTEHRKLVSLTRGERWTWMEVLTYCARQADGGKVPVGITDVLKYVTRPFLEKCASVGLLDKEAGAYRVHDWAIYNAETVAEKVAAFLLKEPDATANQVHRAVGGKRELVLSEYAAQKNGSQPVPERYPTDTPEVPDQSTLVVPLAGAREPVPSTSINNDVVGFTDRQWREMTKEPERANAWLALARSQTDIRNPAAFAWAGFASGAWPTPAEVEQREPNVSASLSKTCPDCGETYGSGHLETCPRMPVTA